MTRLVGLMAAVAAMTVVGGGCGLGGDGDLQQIGSDDLAGLDQTTTSTTTTTTSLTPTPPSATMAVGTTTTGVTTTTVATEPVELYFVAGSLLESVTQELTRGASLSRVLTALQSGPPRGDVGIGLTSVAPPGLVLNVSESGTGIATVDLAGELFEDIQGGVDQRRAIAQIVLTLTKRPGIGQVSFTLDGTPLAVPKRDNVLSAPGEAVARVDYESLLRLPDPSTIGQTIGSFPTPVTTTDYSPPQDPSTTQQGSDDD